MGKSFIDNFKGKSEISIKTFGLKINIQTDTKELLPEIIENLHNIIPAESEYYEGEDFDFFFEIVKVREGFFKVYRNGEVLPSDDKSREVIAEFFLHKLRLTIAEFAGSWVFVHAGVVGWKDQALIFPANSMKGKTTIISEFLKIGAVYYSDEYAVFDENGFVHPFPKDLSVRGKFGNENRKEIPFHEFGSDVGKKPIQANLFFFTEFEKGAGFNPKMLSQGQGLLEIIPHTIPIRQKPDFSMEVLNKAMEGAIIAKCERGEAFEFVNYVLKFIGK